MSSKSSKASDGGWFNSSSASIKRRVSPSPSSTTTTSFSQRKQVAMKELPLDWTRVKRRRREECNIDYNPRTLSKSSPLVVSANEKIHHGYAIFCLHDSTDPTWFQGYVVETSLGDIDDEVIPTSSRRPWGLLATKEKVDACMECENGGFRRIAIKILHAKSTTTTLTGIDWTGGDMMRLSNDKVEMNTKRLLTGKDALPYLKQYFMALCRKLQKACKDGDQEIENEQDILEMLPDVAILVGKISMVLNRGSKSDRVETKTVEEKKDDADLWDD